MEATTLSWTRLTERISAGVRQVGASRQLVLKRRIGGAADRRAQGGDSRVRGQGVRLLRKGYGSPLRARNDGQRIGLQVRGARGITGAAGVTVTSRIPLASGRTAR